MTIRFPAEWETQSALQLSWPHSQTDCARNLCAVEDTLFALAAEAGRRQGLLINCADARQLPRIRHCLTAAQVPAAHLHLTSHPTNDIWVRDHGPISVRPSGGWQLLDFEFNGWGAKYPAALDNQLTARLHADGLFAATPLAQPKLELEGGNLETDGAGTLLANRHSLLHPSRNPGRAPEEVESELKKWLGIERILWLDVPDLEGDDTDGHIDVLARFAGPETIVFSACSDPGHPDYAKLELLYSQLLELRRPDGRPYRLVPLQVAPPMLGALGQAMPLSYVNYILVNGTVLCPGYAHAHADHADHAALRVLQACFPQRRVVVVPALPLVEHGGSLHCATMQLYSPLRAA